MIFDELMRAIGEMTSSDVLNSLITSREGGYGASKVIGICEPISRDEVVEQTNRAGGDGNNSPFRCKAGPAIINASEAKPRKLDGVT
jgi:hypothetical protein